MGYRDPNVAARARDKALRAELAEATSLLARRRVELAELEKALDRSGRTLASIVAGSPAWKAAAVALIMATCTLAAGLSSHVIGAWAAFGLLIAILVVYTVGQARTEKRLNGARAALVERLNAPLETAMPKLRVDPVRLSDDLLAEEDEAEEEEDASTTARRAGRP